MLTASSDTEMPLIDVCIGSPAQWMCMTLTQA